MGNETREAPEKGRARARIRLQERDVDVLESLSVGRFLTVPAIEWLHFPGWRERYRRYLEVRRGDRGATFYPAPNIYHRLVALRSEPGALVHRITRAVERSSVVFSRLPDIYALAEAGASVLCTERGYELDALWYEEPRRKSLKNLEHSVAIGTLYAALRAALEHAGQALADWQGDHRLMARDPARGGPSYDQVRVAGVGDLPVLPDATCSLPGGQRCFVEIDMGTTSLRSWADKIRAYEVYRGSEALRARYGAEDFAVLVIAPTEARLQRIAGETLKVTRQAGPRYRYCLAELVHPTTVRSAWRAVERFDLERRMVVDRLVELPANVVFGAQPLWRTAREP